ncbi:metallophosphoesterase [Candidatus Poribacteria bacterium]|nr:metallophosphoesterase [Candidatus Poribacteria bacterium]
MKRFYQRLNLTGYIILLCCIIQVIQLTSAGCSHTKPYYHPDVPEIERRERETEGVLRYRLLLLGDGGAPKPDEPVLKTLSEWAEKDAAKTSIVFLGDNMYPEGMTERRKHEATERLGPQLSVVKDAGVHGLFIPGNHDWASGASEGYRALLAQEKFINDALAGEQNFLPSGGSPGPVALELPKVNPVVRLIVLDTQWWIHQHEKPQKPPETVIAELITLLDTELPVIVLGHHPLQSYGPHGGYFDWKAHLFPTRALKEWLWIPIPVIGSVHPYARKYFYKFDQDIGSASYDNLIGQLNRAFVTRKPLHQGTPLLIYACGHEHSLQVLKGDSVDYVLVSGAAASRKVTEVLSGENTLFAHQHTGFMAVDFFDDGKVLLRVVEPEGKSVVFHRWLIF